MSVLNINGIATNQSSMDRLIRMFLGISLAFMTAPGVPILEGIWLKYLLFAFALANIFAATTGWCAGYALFGFSTCPLDRTQQDLNLGDIEQLTPDQLEYDIGQRPASDRQRPKRYRGR